MFWTRGSGKRLRGDAAAQVVALYLMSSPATSMVGIFHLALPTLCHETGLDVVAATKGLQRCQEEGIAFWDDAEELVFVPALAKHQIGESLKKTDHKVKGVARALAPFKGHRFFDLFVDRYADAYWISTDEVGASESLDRDDDPVLSGSCPDPERVAPVGALAKGKPSKRPRRAAPTPIPDGFATRLSERQIEHAKGKGYPGWWAKNRFDSFCAAVVAKGLRYADWDQALFNSWKREMTEWGNTPEKLAHLAPRGWRSAPPTPAKNTIAYEQRIRAEAAEHHEAAAKRLASQGEIPEPTQGTLKSITGSIG